MTGPTRRLALILALLSSHAALSDTPPPPEIQAIFKKMHSGQRPTDEEQAQLRAWMLQRSRAADPGAAGQPVDSASATAIPPDIQAIMERMKVGAASDADKARLREWGAAMKAQKGAIISDEQQKAAQLEGAMPPGPRSTSRPRSALYPEGTLLLSWSQTGRSHSRSKSSTFTQSGQVRVPVTFHLDDKLPPLKAKEAGPEAYSLQVMPRQSAGVSGSASMRSHEQSGDCVNDVEVMGTLSSGVVNGELFHMKGKRAFINLMVGVTGNGNAQSHGVCGKDRTSGGGATAVAVPSLFVDLSRTDVPWPHSPGIDPTTAKLYGVDSKLDAETIATRDGASFSFELDAFRKLLGSGEAGQTQGTYRYTMRHHDGDEESSLESTATVTLQVGDLEQDAELVIDPATDWEKWMPVPGLDTHTAGNSVTFRAIIRNKNGNPLTADKKAISFKFELTKVSQLPGVAINWPSTATTEDDYGFEAAKNPKLSISGKGRVAVWNPEVESDGVEAVLSSFDGAGTAELEVTANLKDGTSLRGHLQPRGALAAEQPVLVPHRKPDGTVAQAFLDQVGDGAAESDDTEEVDGSKHKGDGLTVAEEYRGVIAKGAYRRLDPKKAELFVQNLYGADAKPGFDLFSDATGIKVVELQTLEIDDKRIVNHNSPSDVRKGEQHGLRLLTVALTNDDGSPDALTCGEEPGEIDLKDLSKSPQSPADSEALKMNTVWLGGKSASPLEVKECVAHELGHAVGMLHHGTSEQTTGLIRTDAQGHPERLQYFDQHGVAKKPNQMPPQLVDAAGLPVAGTKVAERAKPSQASGDAFCLMSYNNYFHFSGDFEYRGVAGSYKLYLVQERPTLSGVCKNNTSTGYNDARKNGISLFGPANPALTPCASRIRVRSYPKRE